MKRKLLTLSAVVGILLVAGCGTKIKLKDGEEVIASVTDKEITAEELFDALKEKYGKDVLINLIDSYIIDTEITDDSSYKEEAEAQLKSMKSYYESYSYNWDDILSYYGYSSDEEFINGYMDNSKKTDIVKKYLKEDITDDEIDEYYEKEIYGDYTVKHILITPEDSTDEKKQEALEEAESIIEKLNNGESWSDLVSTYSDDDQTKDDDGELPSFTNGDYVDEFFNATIELEEGEYTQEPVETTYGYHIIYLVSKTDKPSKEDSKDTCLEGIATNKLANDDDLFDNTWKSIREKYELNIADSSLAKAYKKES
jgi:foldase protein PrsA